MGVIAKVLSNIFLVICIPVSLIIFVGAICLWQITPLLNTIYGTEAIDIIAKINAGGNDVVSIISNVGLGIFIVFLIIYIFFIVALIIKISLYKSIAGFQVARSKELRNIELNKAQEKLDKYRYRE